MKRFFYPILTAAVALSAISASAAYDGKTWDKTWNGSTLVNATEDKAKDWMADLPDNMFVAHVSIPGTHDSATGGDWHPLLGIGGSTWSTTQSALIEEMMDRGVRAWDFRPGLSGNTVYCAHGSTLLRRTLRDAMEAMTAFLTAHPKEFFVIHFFKGNVDNGDSDAATLNNLLGQIYNEGSIADFIVPFRPDLKVRDVRGKILLFRRDAMSYADLPKAAYINGWHMGFENGNGLTISQGADATQSTQLVVQDWSGQNDGTIDQKKEDCEALLGWTSSQTTPNDGFNAIGSYTPKFAMNFTSRGSSTANYKSNAKTMNPFVNAWFDSHKGEGPVGIIMSDWVLRDEYSSSDLIYNIIENNFYGGQNAPVVRYAIDEELAATPIVYLRNVYNGQYISAGADWDTQATLYKDGIRIRIVENDRGTVNLMTTFGEKGGYIGRDPYVDKPEDEIRDWTMTKVGQYYTFTSYNESTQIALSALTDYTFDYWDGNSRVEYTENVDANDPKQQWEVLTLSEILGEAAAGAESGKEFNVTMIMPEAHVFRVDVYSTSNDTWGNNTTGNGFYWQAEWSPWRNPGMNFIARIYAYWWGYYSYHKTFKDMPNGRYRFSCKIAAKGFNPLDDDFSFTINGVEAKTLVFNASSINGIAFPGEGNQTGLGNEFGQALLCMRPDDVTTTFEFEVTDGTINLEIKNGNGGHSEDYVLYLDDFQFVYLGKDPISFDVDFPMYYNTLTLPFDVEEGVMPENLHAFLATGVTEAINESLTENEGEDYKFHVIQLSDEVKALKANTPYIVINDNGRQLAQDAAANGAPAAKAPARADAADSNTVTFTGFDHAEEAVAGLLTGTHSETTVDEGHYVLTEKTDAFQTFAKVDSASDDTTASTADGTVGAHRAYINVGNTDIDLEHTLVTFNAQLENVLTGVENVGADVNADAPVEYYNLQGVRVVNPQHGIFIRRQGTKAEKIAL